MDDLKLRQELLETISGKKISGCIQCGTCSASCPFAHLMDHAPRELFALARDGEMAVVLSSNTPWFCVSCYQCMSRCPRQIPVTDIMYTLKQMAHRYGSVPPVHKMPDMYRLFKSEVVRKGRVNGTLLMGRYGMVHPGDMMGKIGIGLSLLKKRRVDLKSEKIRRPGHLGCLLEKGKDGK